MGRLLQIEWLKLKKYRGFMVVAILVAAGMLGAGYIAYNVASLVKGTADAALPGASGAVLGNPFDFPTVFHTMAYIASYLQVLPGLLMVLLVGNEYSYRTHRQNVIDGMGRADFMHAKILVLVAAAAAMTVVVFLAACLFGAFGSAGFSLGSMKYVGLSFIQSLSYMSVAMVVVMLVRRTGVAIAIYFVYAYLAENVLALVVNSQIWAGAGYFLPLKSADKLIIAPTQIGRMFNQDLPAQGYLLLAAVVWIVLCLWFCRYRFCKSDL